MGRLNGKIALIIGGGADGPPTTGETLAIGNGRATAIMCAREGAAVMVADLKLDLAEQTANAIRGEDGRAKAVACDVSKEEDCRDAVEAAVREFGALHLLVNNVGIGIGGSLLRGKGVPLRDPRNPSDPELFHDRTLPFMSVMVTIVLLKEACTCTSPCGMCLRSFFLNVFFLPFLSGAAAPLPAAAGFAIDSL